MQELDAFCDLRDSERCFGGEGEQNRSAAAAMAACSKLNKRKADLFQGQISLMQTELLFGNCST